MAQNLINSVPQTAAATPLPSLLSDSSSMRATHQLNHVMYSLGPPDPLLLRHQEDGGDPLPGGAPQGGSQPPARPLTHGHGAGDDVYYP